MSDAMANNTATPRSARAAALERRRALSQGGKAALTQAKVAAGANVRVAASVMSAPTPAPVETAAVVTAQGAASRDGCGCKGKDAAEVAEREQAIEAVCAIVDDAPAAVAGSVASAVRKLCQERRRALSSQGKTAVKSSFTSVSPAHRNGGQSGAMSGLGGRDAARARRETLCQQGRGDDPACRPSGRVRPKPAAPVKVETGTTLRGTGVTGTQVERSGKVTGIEAGSCRAITGTEYIGAEQYGKLCVSTPEAAPAKVSVGTTSRGQRVSGTEVGRSVKVTGDEHGTCKAVTGTEYLGTEQFEAFCDNKPTPAPAKVGVAATQAGQRVSGIEVGRSAKVTGDEPGSCLKLTGSQYVQDQTASLCRSGSGSGAPHKVSVMSTLKARAVTGTDVAPGGLVTGGERGTCAGVTGTESSGLAQYQACNREPVSTPEKVGVMRTWHDQQVSGTAVEHSTKVTGDEYGGCQPISGTEYIGPDQYVAFCDADRQAASRALMASRGAQAGMALSGAHVESGDKVTGAERGESQVLSGTPYSGSHQRVSQRGANSNPHPLARGPVNAPHEAAPAPQAPMAQGNFSIVTPARSAQDSSLNRITGTAYGAIGRITGPVNLAAGLVSGTPEFRYQDGAAAVVMAQQARAVEEVRSRLTGDGREGGFAITGAAWRRNESVTGTEGASTRRNPTLRGDQRGAVMGASQLKERERPELPVSKITGSSGNDAKGSAITYSGGARG
ncbi:CsoS2 family carboxysome shell protein [Sulfuriferula sp.]|uniref:CsoS2 family carboxysome shell protein n=1 Tax=Sulfuriferula sp. TaxID=2025307 RepID=UPI0027313630|nr:CsoS2 family carboxysome shell protein [Sulfuriferula sp.]MDP2027492.1 CsoS2 family carboxysome shell protein [Sulfuriferula sp.]